MDYKKLPNSKISFTLIVEENDLKNAQKIVITNAQKNVSIKGFRKGYAPENLVLQSIGLENLFNESLEKCVDKDYQRFIRENKIKPVSSPKVDFSDIKKFPIKCETTVEIFPEVNLGDYKKIKIDKIKTNVSETEINDVIETIMNDLGVGEKVNRGAKNKDRVLIDFVGKDEKGKTVKNTESKQYPLRLGFSHFLPDLEKAILGMKNNESKEKIPVKFPNDYKSKEIAGKTVFFDVKVYEIREISAKNLKTEDIEKITGKKKSVKEFHEEIKNLIISNKSKAEKNKSIEKYKDDLFKKIKIDLPESWIEGEIEARISQLKNSPDFVANPNKFWEKIGKTEEKIREEFKKEAEFGLKTFLALTEIVKKENINLNKDELEQIKKSKENMNEQGLNNEIINFKITKFFNDLLK